MSSSHSKLIKVTTIAYKLDIRRNKLASQSEKIIKAADLLWEAQHSVTACEPIRGLFDEISIDDAYSIQKINVVRALQQGKRVVGKKIGLTSAAVQKQLGVDQPDFGNIFADTVKIEGDEIDLNQLIQPKVEAEIALVLKKDLSYQDNTIIDLIAAVDYVLPAIEIVDSRISNWDITIHDTIADNASSALVVLGQQPVSLKQLSLTNLGMEVYSKGERVSTGNSAACLGNPLLAALWLANTMAKMQTPLRAGDLILTGALGPMVPVMDEAVFQARIEELGSVSISFVKK